VEAFLVSTMVVGLAEIGDKTQPRRFFSAIGARRLTDSA
jgi:putative Ca2+/H+ antiporter (TMEM165/GDT1 family)